VRTRHREWAWGPGSPERGNNVGVARPEMSRPPWLSSTIGWAEPMLEGRNLGTMVDFYPGVTGKV